MAFPAGGCNDARFSKGVWGIRVGGGSGRHGGARFGVGAWAIDRDELVKAVVQMTFTV